MAAALAARVRRALGPGGHAVLAVSGGLDSSVLLDVAGALDGALRANVLVATFDHGTGAAASRAVAEVERAARRVGVAVAVGRAPPGLWTEDAWRRARWTFLRATAASGPERRVIVTAHTRDDQIETVLLRILRGSGARGLAGLRAPAPGVRRPFVDVPRSAIEAYASHHGVRWTTDPSNEDRRHGRNRLRHDVLPLLRRSDPEIDEALLRVGEQAADWRRALRRFVRASVPSRTRRAAGRTVLTASRRPMMQFDRGALATIWPELAARAGLALDRRGIVRLVDLTVGGRTGSRAHLAGGWEAVMGRDDIVLAPLPSGPAGSASNAIGSLDPAHELLWHRWRFVPVFESASGREASSAPPAAVSAPDNREDRTQDPWRLTLSVDERAHVRRWAPGDQMRVAMTIEGRETVIARKVKYFLSDAGISGHIRGVWPVVVAGGEIVWIPGVRRGSAAAERSGRPAVTYICDYLDR